MCRFKSGIILKTRCVIAQGSDDSHSDLLEEIGMDDTTQNAMTKFVRAELLPPNDEWWTDPDTWAVNIDQDIVPDWFDEDRDRYIEEFREAIKQWWEVHVLVDKTIDKLSGGYYRLKRCEVKKLLKDVQAEVATAHRETFDHDAYWDWVRKMSAKNIVLCSEYSAPADFECIYEKQLMVTLDKNSRHHATEKLYVFRKENKQMELKAFCQRKKSPKRQWHQQKCWMILQSRL